VVDSLFFGTNADRVTRYRAMFGRTHSIVPRRNEITINTSHLVLHVITLLCLAMAVDLAFYD
jgi:hypothetical protein